MRSRSRTVRVVAGVSTLALVGLIGPFLPRGQTIAGRVMVQLEDKKEERKVAAPPIVYDEGPPRAPEPAPPPNTVVTESPVVAAPAASPDPLQAADEFVVRSRKEASRGVETLEKEATALRERLAKVEAALTRYKAALDALNSVPDAPVNRADPFRPAGEAKEPPPGAERRLLRHVPRDADVLPPPTDDAERAPSPNPPPSGDPPQPKRSTEVPPTPPDPEPAPKGERS